MRDAIRIQRDLLEREIELAALRAVLDRTLAGQGGLAVIEGAAGAGKSAVVTAAITYAAAEGLR